MPCSLFTQESYPELTNCPCVTMDDFGGGILLTRHLLATGHTRIGAIFSCGYAFRTFALPGDAACPGGTQVHFRKIPLICWYFSDDPDYGIQKAMQKLISSCTAIVCYNDTIAYALCRAVSDLPQPPEITVASFDPATCATLDTQSFSRSPAEAPGSRRRRGSPPPAAGDFSLFHRNSLEALNTAAVFTRLHPMRLFKYKTE